MPGFAGSDLSLLLSLLARTSHICLLVAGKQGEELWMSSGKPGS